MSIVQGGFLLPKLDGDGKAVVFSSPATPGWSSWITSAGDDVGPPVVRGGGAVLQLSWTGGEARGAKTMSIQFAEPVQMHDGGANFDPSQWGPEDEINWTMVLDATATTVNGGGTGNCNKVALGGGKNLIVPAAGNGGFDVVLANAVPVPSSAATGFWNSDYSTGAVTPGVPSQSLFNLFDFEIKLGSVIHTHFHNAQGEFQLPAYGVAWIHPNWKLLASVTKTSAGAGTITGWIRVFRQNVQIP
jgi:hypothetical protein